jgi:antitoxin (DNA-binding transcriptional repressor) of toxin-antitoxin stability system
MHQVNLKEARTQLAELIEEAASGEKVVITRSDGASFKIVQISKVVAIPKFGSAKGLVRMSDDVGEPLSMVYSPAETPPPFFERRLSFLCPKAQRLPP